MKIKNSKCLSKNICVTKSDKERSGKVFQSSDWHSFLLTKPWSEADMQLIHMLWLSAAQEINNLYETPQWVKQR